MTFQLLNKLLEGFYSGAVRFRPALMDLIRKLHLCVHTRVIGALPGPAAADRHSQNPRPVRVVRLAAVQESVAATFQVPRVSLARERDR